MDTDVIILGGGANGTGTARDLALRGVRVLLCEKNDFAHGATGASSGMIHGGLRYLLHDVGTTEHSCRDSGYIQKICPHILFRIPFLAPVAKRKRFSRLGLMLYDTYFGVYDRYAVLKNGIPHARLTAEELRQVEPGLVGEYEGAVTTDEWGIDPGRLCTLNAMDARAHGADIRTYTQAVGLMRDEAGRVVGARLRRSGYQEVEEVRAKVVLNCGGPWAERVGAWAGGGVRLRPGKGVHLIYEKRLTNFAVLCTAVDGRQVFILPFQNETWIGTTDDDYYGDLDDLWATQDEIRYLQEAVERVIPTIRHQRLIGTRVGVRNTIFGWGKAEDDLSRRYEIVDHAQHGAPGLLTLAGGKLASYRVQSEELADAVCAMLGVQGRSETHLRPLPGGDEVPDAAELARIYGVSELAARRVVSRHGALSARVLDIGRESPTGFAVVDPCEPVLECELRYCVREEMVAHLGDLMVRCKLAKGADMGMRGGLRAAQIFAEERGLDAQDERAGLADLLGRRWRSARPVLSGLQLREAELLMSQFTGLWQAPALVPTA